MAVVMQQQLRAAGIELQIRSAEFGTFYADVTKGAFQMYVAEVDRERMRIRTSFATRMGRRAFRRRVANRGRYVNRAGGCAAGEACER